MSFGMRMGAPSGTMWIAMADAGSVGLAFSQDRVKRTGWLKKPLTGVNELRRLASGSLAHGALGHVDVG